MLAHTEKTTTRKPAPAAPARRSTGPRAAATRVPIAPRGDSLEREAVAVANKIAQQGSAPSGTGSARTDVDHDAIARAIEASGPTRPLTDGTRRVLEDSLGVDLGEVRVHEGPVAATAARILGARAFTRGRDIWLGDGGSQDDLHLLAHEVVHVVQQGAVPARAHAEFNVTRGAPDAVQASWLDDLAALGADSFWSLLDRLAPNFASLLREISSKGIVAYLTEKLGAVFERLFANSPETGDALAAVLAAFGSMAKRAKAIIAGLAGGHCEPLFEAIAELRDILGQLGGEVWESIKSFLQPIGDTFSELWNGLGAPVVEWLQRVAGDVWTGIKALGTEIWAWTAPVRDALASAWNWILEQLGVGGGEAGEGEGGLVQWMQQKAGEAWEAIRAEAAPLIEPLAGLVATVRELLPLDRITELREQLQGFLSGVGSMAATLEAKGGVVEDQGSLRDQILPIVAGALASLRNGLAATGSWITAKVGGLVEFVTSVLATLGDVPFLAPFRGALAWVGNGVRRLGEWATNAVSTLFAFLDAGLVKLGKFVEPLLDVLRSLFGVLGDLVGKLPDLVLGPAFWILPECLRKPIKNFLVEQVLKRIPIFSSLFEIPDLWARVQATALTILRRIFVDGDLVGAAWLFFSSVMRLLGLPPELVTQILARAAAAMGDILANPVGFLINLLSAVRGGFAQFFLAFPTHLLRGITGWLFGALRKVGVEPPADFSLRSVLGFVLGVLDVTMDRIFERLARRIGAEAVEKLRRALDVLSGAWEWVARLVREGPAGLWEALKEKLSDLWTTVLSAISGWVSRVVVANVTQKLLSMLDPSGIMPVIQSLIGLYRAVQSFMEYLREMLEIVHSVLGGIVDIAKGVIVKASAVVEESLASSLPVAIGFLANQVGLGKLGERIGEMVENLREKVGQAIDWMIDKAIEMGRAVLASLGVGGEQTADQAQGSASALEQHVDVPGEGGHEVWIDVEGDSTTLMLASTPGTLRSRLSMLRSFAEDRGREEALRESFERAETIESQIRDRLATAKPEEIAADAQALAEVRSWMSELATTLQSIYSALEITREAFETALAERDGRPIAEFEAALANGPLGVAYTVQAGENGKKVVRASGYRELPFDVEPLSVTSNGNVERGASKRIEVWTGEMSSSGGRVGQGWLGCNVRRGTDPSVIARGYDANGHLIGAQFGGSNGLDNISPMQRKLNHPSFSSFENELKRAMFEPTPGEAGPQYSVWMSVVAEGTTTLAQWRSIHASAPETAVDDATLGAYLATRPQRYHVAIDGARLIEGGELGASRAMPALSFEMVNGVDDASGNSQSGLRAHAAAVRTRLVQMASLDAPA